MYEVDFKYNKVRKLFTTKYRYRYLLKTTSRSYLCFTSMVCCIVSY